MGLVQIDVERLKEAGFTDSGMKRYVDTVSEYSDVLFERSMKIGEARKASDSDTEINYENVQGAVKIISSNFGSDEVPKWKLWAQAGEYLLTATCGYLGSQATQESAPTYFTILFVLAAVFGVGLFIARRTSKN